MQKAVAAANEQIPRWALSVLVSLITILLGVISYGFTRFAESHLSQQEKLIETTQRNREGVIKIEASLQPIKEDISAIQSDLNIIKQKNPIIEQELRTAIDKVNSLSERSKKYWPETANDH